MSEIQEEPVSLETLGCRQYMAEEKRYRVSGDLEKRLHAIERQVTEAREEIHRLLCESPRVPIEEKALWVLAEVGALLDPDQFDAIREEARHVAELKAQAAAYEAAYDRELKARVAGKKEPALVG